MTKMCTFQKGTCTGREVYVFYYSFLASIRLYWRMWQENRGRMRMSYVRNLVMILSLIHNTKRGCLVLLKFAKMTQKASFNNVFTFIKQAMLAKSKNMVLTTWYYSTQNRLLRFISLSSGYVYLPRVFRPPLFDNTKFEDRTERPSVTTKLINNT
jgi:hypothetical protein